MADDAVKPQPTLTTRRLLLRPFRASDAGEVRRLAGEKEIASTTVRIPHPYGPGVAAEWIATHEGKYSKGTEAVFAVTVRADGRLAGAVGLTIDADHGRAEMGFWIGREFWNSGYATEAARAVVAFGFGTLGLEKIHAHHMTRNPASGRVLQKIGMLHEGRLRRHVRKDGVLEDIELYAVLREEFTTES